MHCKSVKKFVDTNYRKVIKYYGVSKFYDTTPYIIIKNRDPFRKESLAEHCWIDNEIILYAFNLTSEKDIIQALIHEYQHYLQSPTWYKRYYLLGHSYNGHPYEIQARKEEENWLKVLNEL